MKKKRASKTAPAELDERVVRSKKAVLKATFELLAEAGLSGVSVDEVSKRSGVAKTTVYRHWPSRSALLLDACANMGSKPQAPDSGSFHGDVSMLAAFFAARLRSDRMATIMPSVIDAAERDPQLAQLQARLHADFLAPLYAVIERAQEKGEVDHNREPSEIAASIVGPLFYRRWFSRQPLDPKFVQKIVDNVAGKSKK